VDEAPKPARRKKKGRPKGASWLKRLPQITRDLERVTTLFLDRKDMERLFGLGPRRTRTLIHELHAEYQGATRLGGALVVSRETVLHYVGSKKRRLPYLAEVARQRTVAQVLQEAKLEVGARAVRFKVSPTPPQGRTIAGLPDTIQLAPGELRIACTSAQDLLEQLYALSRAIAREFQVFQTMVHPE
jgi:hypothetical protein